MLDSGPGFKSQPRRCWVKVDRRIRWHYTTTILLLCIGARLTRYRNCKFQNGCRTISRHADGISRYSVPPSAGPLLPLLRQTVQTYHASVHQAAKWVAALLRVARVTAGLAESSGIYRVGQKNRTVFRLDNFVTVSYSYKGVQYVKIFEILSRKMVQNSHFNEFKYSWPNLLKSSQQLKLCYI